MSMTLTSIFFLGPKYSRRNPLGLLNSVWLIFLFMRAITLHLLIFFIPKIGNILRHTFPFFMYCLISQLLSKTDKESPLTLGLYLFVSMGNEETTNQADGNIQFLSVSTVLVPAFFLFPFSDDICYGLNVCVPPNFKGD